MDHAGAWTGFVFSVLHAAFPSHWLPFVLVGRSLKWSKARTLAVLGVAGGIHVVVTSALGVLFWKFGDVLKDKVEDFEHVAVNVGAGLLLALGALYLLRHFLGGHAHSHGAADVIYADEHARPAHAHETEEEHQAHAGHARAKALAERGAVMTLLLALTLSPCGAAVPVLLVGLSVGFTWVIGAALAISLSTVAVMFLLTWLTLRGVEWLEAPWLDRYELLLTGSLLVTIGIAVLVLHGH